MLSREGILEKKDSKFEDVVVPEWDGETVRIKCMTGAERDEYEALLYDFNESGVKMKRDNLRTKLVIFTAVDENMERLFTVKDIEELGKKSAKAIDRLHAVAQRLNALSKDEMDKIEKN